MFCYSLFRQSELVSSYSSENVDYQLSKCPNYQDSTCCLLSNVDCWTHQRRPLPTDAITAFRPIYCTSGRITTTVSSQSFRVSRCEMSYVTSSFAPCLLYTSPSPRDS